MLSATVLAFDVVEGVIVLTKVEILWQHCLLKVTMLPCL